MHAPIPDPLPPSRHALNLIVQPVSYFCGLILNHPPGQRYILPYPQRGHVIMADPNPVLLYQVR